jgi:hypothetical protein
MLPNSSGPASSLEAFHTAAGLTLNEIVDAAAARGYDAGVTTASADGA